MEQKKIVFPIFTLFLGLILLVITGRFTVILLSSIFLSYVIRPIYEFVRKFLVNKSLSTLVSQLIFAVLFVSMIIFVFNSIYSQLKNAGSFFIKSVLIDINESLINGTIPYLDLNNPFTLQTFNNLLVFGQDIITSAPVLLLDIFLISFISFYFIRNMEGIYSTILSMLPSKYNASVSRFLSRSASITKSILYSYFLNALFVGLLCFVIFTILRISYAFDYALFATIASLFPIVGTWIIPVFLSVYYFIRSNYIVAFILILVAIIISYLTSMFRFIIRRQHEQIHPLLFIIGVFVGLYSLGFLGFLTGPIVFGVLQIGFEEVFKIPGKNSLERFK